MDDLVPQYRRGRRRLRRLIKINRTKIRRLEAARASIKGDDELADIELRIGNIESDLSHLESMLRDMTEVISMMARTYADSRAYSGSKEVLMDPTEIRSQIEIRASQLDPDLESSIRKGVREYLGKIVKKRMGRLTIKQRTTLERWLDLEKNIADIAREDGVSRQAIWIRLFGDKTNRGALKILRGE